NEIHLADRGDINLLNRANFFLFYNIQRGHIRPYHGDQKDQNPWDLNGLNQLEEATLILGIGLNRSGSVH
ncbi:MAG: hypothetical protein ACI8SN_002478, partial [Algoriphagus sp.]